MSKKIKPDAWYQQMLDRRLPKKKIARNGVVAFVSGGVLCALAELADALLQRGTTWNSDERGTVVLVCLIGIVALLTGLGFYDKLGQKLGAGLAVPISGFANSVVASMIEHRSEGMVLGSGCNSFKLAGAVVVFGIASAFVVSFLALLLGAV